MSKKINFCGECEHFVLTRVNEHMEGFCTEQNESMDYFDQQCEAMQRISDFNAEIDALGDLSEDAMIEKIVAIEQKYGMMI